ncbi:sterol desaturase family protein [Pseudaestuariivita atlantica]|uniref:Desaturase n=1 Tax=Pseudaestuariivita atlantica TaxID=1317121 RepID=A0A0L1JKB1_9RHOB|nr:sterol desaturase family protein [Pseudaestuariivita atlantica]KNG92157.1 desaturase [Pseudaestuariivita atlantica]
MENDAFGTRDKRGHWRPNGALSGVAPIYALPPQPMRVLRWLPEYLLPWNALFAATALLYWWLVVPPAETMQTLSLGWIWPMLAVNAVAVFLFYGVFELRLYVRRAQGARFKYNPAFPADRPSKAFWWSNQTRDCIARTFLSGVPIWTALQVLILWAWANGVGAWVTWEVAPVWLVVLMVLVPVVHEAHFYAIHRLIHVPFLYRHVHSVHHASVNPSPWSSLAMHPVEHLLYFAGALWYLLIPAHPVIALFALHRAGFGAIPGHVGFDKVELGGDRAMDTHAYAHYLHHKFFEVNYGDGLVPFDALFGTFHDGTPDGDMAMRARLKERRERQLARDAQSGA